MMERVLDLKSVNLDPAQILSLISVIAGDVSERTQIHVSSWI